MFNFFLPASKVQKDRRIMRETDARMAKYSRRGVVFNFFAFLVCLSHGRFIEENPTLMLVLTIGLALITCIRGFYLFRFDHLYPRAPAKWRDRYFVATLLGALWWGFILASVTFQLRMQDEAPLLWLYTVIFFSATAHAFAPYQKFLSYYQFLGQIPAAAAAFFLFSIEGYLYGTMLLGFYLVLTHQCRLISENYWERLEATYALARKTLSIEEEKRDTRANVALNREFLKHLNSDIDHVMRTLNQSPVSNGDAFRTLVKHELDELHQNICDFNGVLSKELALQDYVFNIRHEIQHLVTEFVEEAESRHIQIETSLSPNLPMRLRGDASRLAQIIRSLLNIVLHDVEKCLVLVEVEFIREYESAGELYVGVTRSFDKAKKIFFTETESQLPQGTLSLVVAKGLAELMNGSIEFNDVLQEEQQFRFNAKIDIAEFSGQLDFHKGSFQGRNVLLLNQNPRIVDLKRQELDALGFNVFTETQYKRAIQTLEASYKFQNPIESLVFYVEPDEEAAFAFCQKLLESSDIKYTKKIAAATKQQQEKFLQQGFDETSGFYFVEKPMGLFEIESVFHHIYKEQLYDNDEYSKHKDSKIVLLSQANNEKYKFLIEDEQFGSQVSIVNDKKALFDLLIDKTFQMVLLDCDTQTDIADLVNEIRESEKGNNFEGFMPILGCSLDRKAFEDTAFELGLDDYIDLGHSLNKSLTAMILYWSTLIRRD